VCDIVVKKFTFAISSPDEFLYCCRHACLMIDDGGGYTDCTRDLSRGIVCTCQLCTCRHISVFIVENSCTVRSHVDLYTPVIQCFAINRSTTNRGSLVFHINNYRDMPDSDRDD